MTLKRRASLKWQSLNLPLSYRVNENRPRFQLLQNAYSNMGRLDTRYGTSRYNSTALGGTIMSCSFFKTVAGVRYKIVKVGTALYSVNASGAHTTIKTGLTSGTKHRGVTLNNRHLISCEADGLFQWDGTTFTVVGQNRVVTSGISLAAAAGTANLATASWYIKFTYYSSTTGFETNVGDNAAIVGPVSITLTQQINVTGFPATPGNATIDKVRVYLRSGTSGDFLFSSEFALATSFSIVATPTGTGVGPTTNANWPSGSKGSLAIFNGRLVTHVNNDIVFSEEYFPDAVDDTDTSKTIFIPGQGVVNGVATGFFNNSVLDPYLVIFKRSSTWVYSEINNSPRLSQLDDKLGCVSDRTIITRNGRVFFLSDSGWREVRDGLIVKTDEQSSLAGGDIDDIFGIDVIDKRILKSDVQNFFAVYYSDKDLYYTFISEVASNTLKQAYVYQFKTNGFTWFDFPYTMTCAMTGEDDEGYETIFLCDSSGYLYTHSVNELRKDQKSDASYQSIPVTARLLWIDGTDMATTFNFRQLYVRSLAALNDVTVKAYLNYDSGSISNTLTYDRDAPGFTLDVSRLDIDPLTGDRRIVTSKGDIRLTGENIAIEFYQNVAEANIGLVALQLDFSKNGNRN